RSTSLPELVTDVVFPSASMLALTWPLWYQIPGAPVTGFESQAPWPVTLPADVPSGLARSWKDPVAGTVRDLPAPTLGTVSVLPGKTPSSLTGLPDLSVKVVSISLPSMWPRTGKEHWPVISWSSGAGMTSRIGLFAPAVGATTSATSRAASTAPIADERIKC